MFLILYESVFRVTHGKIIELLQKLQTDGKDVHTTSSGLSSTFELTN